MTVVELFEAALEVPEAGRAAFLDQACTGDETLLRKVKALLKAHERANHFLDQPATRERPETGAFPTIGEKPGDQIGRYKLLQQIGEGGWGVVFMAEQEEPLRRRVALKIVKPGMDTKNVVARFEAERQALALMDHPNIAHVFDAGATASGRPYFVMELVRGVKVTDYCDQNSLTTAARLELFTEICDAVQHAHQKGIVHRDIKPSNILVSTTPDGRPSPKVIDFGIAKATTNQRLTDKTLFTAFEMLIGTPAYMSPEQAALTNLEVDTRTDIYSLGVLLYELLTGTTPFDARELLKAGLDEVRRVIRNEEPVRPSTRLSAMVASQLTTLSHSRQVEPPKLIREVRGDLDWIVMKALEKDPCRRYATANGLATDVKRYAAGEPISARPPSRIYRFQKLLLRNKLLFGGIALLAVLLVTSLVFVSASLARERRARLESDKDKQKAQQVTRFLENMLQGVGPSVALGRDTTMLREILDKTAVSVATDLTNQPAVEAELKGLIGRLYLELGNYERAQQMQRAAVVLNERLHGPESEETATALNDLGNAFWRDRKLAEAQAAYESALAIRRRLFRNDHADVAETLNNLGAVYRRQQRLAESESLTRESLQIRRRLFGNEHLAVADSLRNLCIILGDRGKREEAESTAREMLALRRRLLGNEHPLVAAALADLAWVKGLSGKKGEAEALDQEAFGIRQRVLGDEHPEVARSVYLLGEHMRQRGELAESHAVLNAALSIQRKLLGNEHPDVLATLSSLAATLESENQWAAAEAARRETLAGWRKQAGDEAPQTLAEWNSLIHALKAQNKLKEAEQAAGEVLTPALMRNPASIQLLSSRIDLRGRQGRWPEAAADAALLVKHQPSEHYWYHLLAPLLVCTSDHPAYERLCRTLMTGFTNTLNPYVADRVARDCLLATNSQVNLSLADQLADLALSRGKGERAYPLFQVTKALAEYRQGHFAESITWAAKGRAAGDIHTQANACAVLAMAYWRLGHADEARANLAEGDAAAPRIVSRSNAQNPGADWMTWLFARVSLDEATALIPPLSAAGNNVGKP